MDERHGSGWGSHAQTPYSPVVGAMVSAVVDVVVLSFSGPVVGTIVSAEVDVEPGTEVVLL